MELLFTNGWKTLVWVSGGLPITEESVGIGMGQKENVKLLVAVCGSITSVLKFPNRRPPWVLLQFYVPFHLHEVLKFGQRFHISDNLMMTSFPTDHSNRRIVRPAVPSTNVTLDSSASHISFIMIGQLSKRCQKISVNNE